MGGWLDLVILEVFSNLNDSMILLYESVSAALTPRPCFMVAMGCPVRR